MVQADLWNRGCTPLHYAVKVLFHVTLLQFLEFAIFGFFLHSVLCQTVATWWLWLYYFIYSTWQLSL